MRLGLHFAAGPPKHVISSFDVHTDAIDIPPGATAQVVTARYSLPVGARVLSLQPHMHLRGRSFPFDAVGRTAPIHHLLSVPTWDIRSQLAYLPAEPIDLAAGSRLVVTRTYAMSDGNPAIRSDGADALGRRDDGRDVRRVRRMAGVGRGGGGAEVWMSSLLGASVPETVERFSPG